MRLMVQRHSLVKDPLKFSPNCFCYRHHLPILHGRKELLRREMWCGLSGDRDHQKLDVLIPAEEAYCRKQSLLWPPNN